MQISIFDGTKPFKIIKPIRLITLFSGYDSQALSLKYLGIPFDYWTYKSEWYDPFENPDTQWQRLTDALNNKSAERSDLVKWLFPTLNDDEVAEKMVTVKDVVEYINNNK